MSRLDLNLDRVRQNVQKASTEDLLDRATVYRSEMEVTALPIIDAELSKRGVSVDEVQAHLESRKQAKSRADGTILNCSFCYKPAMREGWGWHRLFGVLPVFPRPLAWCADHDPGSKPIPVADKNES